MATELYSLLAKNFYPILLFIYFLSINILPILGFSQTEQPGLFSAWNFFWLFSLGAVLFIKYRFSLFSKKYLPLTLLYILSILLTSLSAVIRSITDIFSVSTDMIVPAVYMILLLVIMGKYELSIPQLKLLNKMYIAFALYVLAYNVVVNGEELIMLLSGVYDANTLLTSAFYTNRNIYGLMLAFGVCLSIMELLQSKSRRSQALFTIVTIVLAVGVLMSMSRGAILFMSVFGAIYLIKTLNFKKIVMSLVVVCALSLAVMGYIGASQFQDLIVRSDSGITGRDQVYAYGIDRYISNDVLLGSGPQASGNAVTRDIGVVSYHNTALSYLVNGGIILLMIVAGVYVLSIRIVLRLKNAHRNFGVFFMSLITAYLAYGLFESGLLFIFSPNSFILSLYTIALPLYFYNYAKKD